MHRNMTLFAYLMIKFYFVLQQGGLPNMNPQAAAGGGGVSSQDQEKVRMFLTFFLYSFAPHFLLTHLSFSIHSLLSG